MKWIGISGTWRTTDATVEERVRAQVRGIIARGHGIVAGGATGVDYFATDEALKAAPDAALVKVVLPSTFDDYIEHLTSWSDGYDTGDPSVAPAEIEKLVRQLHTIREANPAAIIEGPAIAAPDICQNYYYARDTVVAQLATELVAFQVNKSKGTQDTINKAMSAGKAVTLFSFTVEQDRAYGRLKAPSPPL